MTQPNPQFNISPQIDPQIQQLFWSYNNAFQEGFLQEPSPVVDKLCLEVAGGGGTVTTFYWMENLYPPRLWSGSRVLRNLATRGNRFDHKRYELSTTIDKTVALGDKSGVFAITMGLLGRKTGRWLEYILARAMKCGEGTYVAVGSDDANEIQELNNEALAYWDGTTFFGTHPVDVSGAVAGSNINLLTSISSLSVSTLISAIEAGKAFKGVDGLAMGLFTKFYLVVPPQLYLQAVRLLSTQFLGDELSAATAGTVDNYLRAMGEVVEFPYLSDKPTEWYLVDKSMDGQFPFAAVRNTLEITQITDPSNPEVFMNDRYVYGSRISGGIAFCDHLRIIKCRP